MNLARLSSEGLGFPSLAFLVPLLVRVVPELLMSPFVVGFDTISYYVPVVVKWVGGGVDFFQAMAHAPLFYVLLVALAFAGVPVTVSLKVVPPVLLGFLGLAVFAYARRSLVWPGWKSLSVALLATLNFVSLRVSWDMLRSVLSLIFLFVFLSFLHKDWTRNSFSFFALASSIMVLVVLSHQLVSVVMFAVLSVVALRKLLRHDSVVVRNLVLCAVPAIAFFGLILYSSFAVSPSFSPISGFPNVESGGWFSLFGFGSYSGMAVDAGAFVLFCCLPLLPFAVVGFKTFRKLELVVWIVWCLGAALSSIVSPYAFVIGGYRWTLLLAFPLSFFAVEALSRIGHRLWKGFFCALLILLSFSFVVLPAESAFPFFNAFPNYVPSSMLQNSVPLRDCDDVVKVLSWCDRSLGSDGVLLVHDAFHGWALLYLNSSSRITCYGYDNPENAALGLVREGSKRVFLVWWVSGEGWHGVESLPSSFVEVYRSGRMALYEFGAA